MFYIIKQTNYNPSLTSSFIEPPPIQRITRSTIHLNPFVDDVSLPATIIKNQTHPLSERTCQKSIMSLRNKLTLTIDNSHTVITPTTDTNKPTPTIDNYSKIPQSSYPILKKIGIPTNFAESEIIVTLQSIIHELERLCNQHKLYYSRLNNTIARPFFLPSAISSSKAFYNWDRKGNGLSEILEFMSNQKIDSMTSEPIAVSFAIKRLLNNYPNSFHNVVSLVGYIKHN